MLQVTIPFLVDGQVILWRYEHEIAGPATEELAPAGPILPYVERVGALRAAEWARVLWYAGAK